MGVEQGCNEVLSGGIKISEVWCENVLNWRKDLRFWCEAKFGQERRELRWTWLFRQCWGACSSTPTAVHVVNITRFTSPISNQLSLQLSLTKVVFSVFLNSWLARRGLSYPIQYNPVCSDGRRYCSPSPLCPRLEHHHIHIQTGWPIVPVKWAWKVTFKNALISPVFIESILESVNSASIPPRAGKVA